MKIDWERENAIRKNMGLYQEQLTKDYDKEMTYLIKIKNAQWLYKNAESGIKLTKKKLDRILTNRLWLYAKISECKNTLRQMPDDSCRQESQIL